jgi:hypothetical protein
MKRPVLILSIIITIVFAPIISTRAKAKKTFAGNSSTATTCAEEDNVNVCLSAKRVRRFQVVAKHPAYTVGSDNCAADFSGCGSAFQKRIAQAANPCETLLDDGTNVIQLCEELDWWRPHDMAIQIGNISASGHRLVLSKKIEGEASWPQFFVLYEDGNMRLKPHPPVGRPDVCFGSSVIVGPAAPSARPFVDIQTITIDPTTLCLSISYRGGGNARICLSVDRAQSVAEVEVDYDISNCFTVFRSMWVEDGNSDVDHIEAKDRDIPILDDWDKLKGPSWFFHRKVRSKHNTSAPDILIEALK